MMRIRTYIHLLIFASLAVAVRATFIIHNYDVREDWAESDLIGWVRVEEVLAVPTPGKDEARVRLKLIESLKGKSASTLTLVYPDRYVAPGNADEVITLGHEQRWRESLGKEFLVFLKQRPDEAYETRDGYYFAVVNGWLLGLSREYQEHFGLQRNPRIAEFIAKYRAHEPSSSIQAGSPLLATPLRVLGKRIETPGQRIGRFLSALNENRSLEAESMLYRPRDYATPRYIWDEQSGHRLDLARVGVTWEAVLDHRAIVELTDKKVGGEPVVWYLLFDRKQWRLVNPYSGMREDSEAVAKVKAAPDFRRLIESWKKLRPNDWNRER